MDVLNARSRRTREALLAATRELLETEGLGAVTMGSVADRAGVTRRSVYLHFESRSALIAGLFDYVAAAEGLHESLATVWNAPTARDALLRWAGHLARYHARVLPVDRAMAQVYRNDPDAAAHRRRAHAAKLGSCRRLAQRLYDEGELAAGWSVDDAADMLNAISTSDVVESLLKDRRWTQQKFIAHLGGLLQAALAQPARARTRRKPRPEYVR